ncbi:uncharacterized protein EI97DRAFT_459620 [Westerdykella ornata]|uniref:PAC domain-containing protein n=1 Tax=Westerdykella ornata TaxID=318751 RepID=A0A6A6JF80_WESOR|nr:uncharacterized protein EI97DRAFT_459620 [Westerdykella ornata]KAF2274977.1 hypothetical protein EI97DRAFT_459620 [Westerdykella ornata]
MPTVEVDTSAGAERHKMDSTSLTHTVLENITNLDESLYDEPQQLHSESSGFPRTPSPRKQVDADLHPLRSNPVTSSPEEESARESLDLSRRGIHIPTRTSSTRKAFSSKRRFLRSTSTPVQSIRSHSIKTTPRSFSGANSSTDSFVSYETVTPTFSRTTQRLSPQPNLVSSPVTDRLDPLLEDDPSSFDLVPPENRRSHRRETALDALAERLFSKLHLEAIFRDTSSLAPFTSFITNSRPNSIPILLYYLDALKALRAINYANAIAETLEPLDDYEFTQHPPRPTVNAVLEDKARQAFDVLVRDELPAYIAHVFSQVVSDSIQKRVAGQSPAVLQECGEGLAEVFCISDPSREDNPIIFASQEFHRTTQYGASFALGRNCRFLQGPKTSLHSAARLRRAVSEGKDITELLLNYRRDGTPFMNLLTISPLLDSHGQLRYWLGAQVDVSGLVKNATGLDTFEELLKRGHGERAVTYDETKDEFRELSEMFNEAEVETLRKFGSSKHREVLKHGGEEATTSILKHSAMLCDIRRRDGRSPVAPGPPSEGGPYKHYLIIRPTSTHRILFASPSLRPPTPTSNSLPQTPFLDHVGGSTRVRNALAEALMDGTRGVTAKIRWLAWAGDEEGRSMWIHCTPLFGENGAVGCWIVVLVDGDGDDWEGKRRSGLTGLREARVVDGLGSLRADHVRGKGKARGSERDEMAGLPVDGNGVSDAGAGGEDARGRKGKRYSLPLESMSWREDGGGERYRSRPRSLVVGEKVERLATPSSSRMSAKGTSVRSFGLG